MKKPNIIALPTSQMQSFCDVLGLGKEVQGSLGSMVTALEDVNWAVTTVAFKPDKLPDGVVAERKKRLGIA